MLYSHKEALHCHLFDSLNNKVSALFLWQVLVICDVKEEDAYWRLLKIVSCFTE